MDLKVLYGESIPGIVTKLVWGERSIYFYSSCVTHKCFTWAYTPDPPLPQACTHALRYFMCAPGVPGSL